jgi:hypothetical protein
MALMVILQKGTVMAVWAVDGGLLEREQSIAMLVPETHKRVRPP